ncbi:MAG: tetratricopeptide repeat protein [Pyrinomonadaceae bacterium]
MTTKKLQSIAALVLSILISSALAQAQSGSTRPRRVNQRQPASQKSNTNKSVDEPLLDVQPVGGNTANNNSGRRSSSRSNNNDAADTSPLLTPSSSTSTSSSSVSTASVPSSSSVSSPSDTTRAYALLQQKQYAEAARLAKTISTANPNDSEAWKIAGFAEMNMKQYAEAASDLQKAMDLQRVAGQEDPNTADALAEAYVFTEKFDQALPLLVAATTRKGAASPDASLLYYRGLAELRTGKAAEAERSFNAAVKANPKDAASLYFLGQIAFSRNDLDGTIAMLNRATIADQRVAAAWSLLTTAYLRRAAANSASDTTKADADYLSAVRAGEGLTRINSSADSAMLFGQALIGAKQYARAATVLERATAGPDAKGSALYLLGISYSRAKNFPKAIAALERAASKTPDDVNIYRELGYAYEVSKLYAKALAAYEKGSALAPADTDFQESIARVRPVAQKQ